MPTPRQVAAWQRRYDRGESTASIAARAGVDRTTVRRAIDTQQVSGPRAAVTPVDAVAAMRSEGTVAGAAARLDVSVMQIRHGLWRAGVANDPLRRGRGDWDWETDGAARGRRWDIEDRLRIRDRLVAQERAAGVADPDIAVARGMDLAVVEKCC